MLEKRIFFTKIALNNEIPESYVQKSIKPNLIKSISSIA